MNAIEEALDRLEPEHVSPVDLVRAMMALGFDQGEVWSALAARTRRARSARRAGTKTVVDHNLQGLALEHDGDVRAAVGAFESSISGDSYAGSGPYERLAIIYRRNRMYGDEVRVLRELVTWLERRAEAKKLHRFRDRLEKAEALRVKHDQEVTETPWLVIDPPVTDDRT